MWPTSSKQWVHGLPGAVHNKRRALYLVACPVIQPVVWIATTRLIEGHLLSGASSRPRKARTETGHEQGQRPRTAGPEAPNESGFCA